MLGGRAKRRGKSKVGDVEDKEEGKTAGGWEENVGGERERECKGR